MSRSDFPAEEFDARLRTVKAALIEAGLDWFLAFHPASIHWLTGAEAKSYQAFQCLLIPARDAPLVMFTREAERAEFTDEAHVGELFTWGGPEPEDPLTAFVQLTSRLGIGTPCAIGMEVPAFYLHPAHDSRLKESFGRVLVDVPNLIHDLRLIKSPRELEFIREAANIADLSVMALERALAIGRTETEVAGEVCRTIMAAGGDQPAVPINLVSGPRAGYSHGAPTGRRFEPGDFGNAEYGVPYRRYTVTVGRTFAVGVPSARMRQVFDVARAASDAAIEAIRDGVPATAPHEAAKSVIDEAGLGAGRVHTSGYAVAPAFPPATGEPLHLFGGSPYTLRANMVLSVCPPIFIQDERLGARIVDNVLVTETGAQRLSSASRDLIVID